MSKIKLQSSDLQIFEVDVAAAYKSTTIKTMLQDLGAAEDDVVPLPNIDKKILAKIIEWAEYHKDDPEPEEDDDEKEIPEKEISNWDKEFLKMDDEEELYDLIVAANYLDIKNLMELATRSVAEKLKGKTAAQIREMYDIKNDLEPPAADESSSESTAVNGSSSAPSAVTESPQSEPPAAVKSSSAPPATGEPSSEN